MTKTDLTAICLIVDRSGSMAEIQADAEGGVNAFIDEQKAQPGEALFTLVHFDHYIDTVQELEPVKEAKRYKLRPRGNTALYDAVGRTVTDLGEQFADMDEAERPGKVIVVIVTDGHENSSREWTQEKVFELVKRQQDEWNWEFIYLSADANAWDDGARLGVPHANTQVIPNTARGMSNTYGMVANTMSSYRSTGRVETKVVEDDA